MTRDQEEEQFEQFRAALADDKELVKFQQALAAALATFESRGLLEKLPPEHAGGNQQEILVHQAKETKPLQLVRIEDVLIGAVSVGERLLAATPGPAVRIEGPRGTRLQLAAAAAGEHLEAGPRRHRGRARTSSQRREG